MPRSRHPNKEIEAVVAEAEARGWRVMVGGSHAWGFLYCPESARDGCRVAVYSTPRSPESHARRLRREIVGCPHSTGE
ncbi:hypothetical protein [Tautonia marina]|uniref:hypothetical protein n=1 Tax=Tautonia marina TaxID=2653855 RepID=UPI001260F43E|nr:hypothetical protein [Tautonia marina]